MSAQKKLKRGDINKANITIGKTNKKSDTNKVTSVSRHYQSAVQKRLQEVHNFLQVRGKNLSKMRSHCLNMISNLQSQEFHIQQD